MKHNCTLVLLCILWPRQTSKWLTRSLELSQTSSASFACCTWGWTKSWSTLGDGTHRRYTSGWHLSSVWNTTQSALFFYPCRHLRTKLPGGPVAKGRSKEDAANTAREYTQSRKKMLQKSNTFLSSAHHLIYSLFCTSSEKFRSDMKTTTKCEHLDIDVRPWSLLWKLLQHHQNKHIV